MSFLAWIDFDQADRDRTRRIMDLFNQEDSRDELGLGSIRDALADLMFPGTSVIQTRLRYMLFVPWIFRMASARGTPAAPRQHQARGLEIRLIQSLIAGGETTGVIGSEARERLKRLPSDVYWAGLGTWGIRTEPGNRADYLALPPEHNPWSPGLPPAPADLLERTSFALTNEEAGFLRDRLVASAPGTLLTELALAEDPAGAAAIWLHPGRAGWSARNRLIVTQAEAFARAMHGAALLYNLMLAEAATAQQGADAGRWQALVETYRKRLNDWHQDMRDLPLADWDLDTLWSLAAGTSHRITPVTRRFIADWRGILPGNDPRIADNAAARSLIADREARLKGPKARLRVPSALARWSGASGTERLNFRWGTVSQHLKDLADAG